MYSKRAFFVFLCRIKKLIMRLLICRQMERLNHNSLVEIIEPFLGPDDDSAFWNQAIHVLVSDIESEISERPPDRDIYLTIGACSHWLRPHQTRWAASGGFAWPTGYGGGTLSRRGLPQFDWSVIFLWDVNSEIWEPVNRFKGKKKLTFRAALPTRTTRHDQSAVHTLWEPGSPIHPTKKRVRFYGFRKREQDWACVESKDIWQD